MSRSWSQEQHRIFDWFEGGLLPNGAPAKNLVVEAFAGTGKTTTIVEGVNRAPEASILVCAYNKKIEQELVRRIANPKVTVKTLHALGLSIVTKYRERLKIDFGKDRAEGLTNKVCGPIAPDAIKKLVTKLHTLGREIAPHAAKLGDLTNVAIQFECEPDDVWEESFNLEYVEARALDAMALAAQVESGATIDGADMIFLPVRNGWLSKRFDLVVVDEAQDMTTAQLEIAQGVCRGRIAVVGDPNQAIYGFRGADSGSLGRLKAELKAGSLSLSTTYRCGRAIVAEANRYVPAFRAGADNPQGRVSSLDDAKLVAEAAAGDFILSRVNAPLVSYAMSLLRAGKRAQIAGRDIGKGLVALVRKLKARSVPEFIEKIAAWERREIARVDAAIAKASNGRKATLQAKRDGIADQASMLLSVSEGARSVDDVTAKIEALFTDDGLGTASVVTLSSVHKAKGLEANRVFVLAWTLRDTTDEERNICYVAVTRAKEELVYVMETRS